MQWFIGNFNIIEAYLSLKVLLLWCLHVLRRKSLLKVDLPSFEQMRRQSSFQLQTLIPGASVSPYIISFCITFVFFLAPIFLNALFCPYRWLPYAHFGRAGKTILLYFAVYYCLVVCFSFSFLYSPIVHFTRWQTLRNKKALTARR